MSAAGGGGEGGGGGQPWQGVFGCTGPLRPQRCAEVGIGGEVRGVVFFLGGGGGSTSENIQTISISLQNSFCGSHNWRLVSGNVLRALIAHWSLPGYHAFEHEKSNGSDQKPVKQKIPLKTPIGVIKLLHTSLEMH